MQTEELRGGVGAAGSGGHVFAPQALRRCVVTRLRSRHAEIEEAIFTRVSDRWFERTGSDDPEYVAGLQAAGVAALDYVLMRIEGRGDRLAPVPVEVLQQARRAARTGVGAKTVLRRYMAGRAVLEDFVMQEAESGVLRGQESVLREVLAILSAMVDRVTVAVSCAYDKECDRIDKSERISAGAGRNETIPTSAGSGANTARVSTVELPSLQHAAHSARHLQHERIVRAIVEVVAERGVTGVSVGLVVERARVSRRTFYKLFGGLEDGLVAVMEGALGQVGRAASEALEEETSWLDGVRRALAAVLAFLDSEPELARVCLVETLGGAPKVVEQRERIVGAFRALIVARLESDGVNVPPLAAEGAMVSVMGVVRARLIAREPEPLITLLGPLMGRIVVPFLADDRLVAEEIRRGEELARAIQAGGTNSAPPSAEDAATALVLPAILDNPTARRARECVRFLAEHPDCSNHEVASGIGITQKSQTSALLSRLVEEDIVVKRSEGLGKRNAWRLTPPGEEIAEALSKLEGRAALAETDSPPSIVGQSEHDLHESAT